MAAVLDELVQRLRKALGENLVSVVLHGSAATGDHQEKFSDFNVLCLLQTIGPDQLRACEGIFRWWRERGNPAPLLMTSDELRTSADCFAIEFHDIGEHHRILWGPDLVSPVAIDNRFYRGQVEHDLRAKLLRLRQKAAGVASDKNALRRLLADSVSTFCVLFRHALVLCGAADPVPVRRREVIELARGRFGIDPAPFRALIDLREAKVKPKDVDPLPLLETYLREIDKVIGMVDREKAE